MVIATVGGPLLFLLGNILFKRMIRGWLQLSHLGGLALLLLAAVPAAPWLPPVAFATLVTLVLVVVAVWETLTLPQA